MVTRHRAGHGHTPGDEHFHEPEHYHRACHCHDSRRQLRGRAVVGYQIAAKTDTGISASVSSIWAAPGQNSFRELAEPFGEGSNSPHPSLASLSQ
jgi:hypothetical protein